MRKDRLTRREWEQRMVLVVTSVMIVFFAVGFVSGALFCYG